MDRVDAVERHPGQDRHRDARDQQSDRDGPGHRAAAEHPVIHRPTSGAGEQQGCRAERHEERDVERHRPDHVVETFTAHASTIAPITAHAASGVRTPNSRPSPPRVSAVVTMRAANVGRLQPPLSMKPAVVLKSAALIRPACSIVAPSARRRMSRPVSVIDRADDVAPDDRLVFSMKFAVMTTGPFRCRELIAGDNL